MRKITEKTTPSKIISKLAVILLSAVYCLLMPLLAGVGLISNRSSYGAYIAFIGAAFILSAFLMTAGAAICSFCGRRKNIAALCFSVSGCALCLILLHKLCIHADISGWSDKFTMERISSMYRRRLTPCIIPSALNSILAVRNILSAKKSAEKYTPIL